MHHFTVPQRSDQADRVNSAHLFLSLLAAVLLIHTANCIAEEHSFSISTENLSRKKTKMPVLRDADGKEWKLDEPGRVTVVILNTDRTARQARDMAKALDEFQGRTDFRALVIVNLHESLGRHVRPVTLFRIRHDLDAEARRIEPLYRKNSNPNDPRKDIGAVPDFDGSITRALGFNTPHTNLRVMVFGKDGVLAARWDPADDREAVRKKVRTLLIK